MYQIIIYGYANDQDATEYVADVITGYKTKSEALKAKKELLEDENGLWADCDVYAEVKEVE